LTIINLFSKQGPVSKICFLIVPAKLPQPWGKVAYKAFNFCLAANQSVAGGG
jgi:hypothetical protein